MTDPSQVTIRDSLPMRADPVIARSDDCHASCPDLANPDPFAGLSITPIQLHCYTRAYYTTYLLNPRKFLPLARRSGAASYSLPLRLYSRKITPHLILTRDIGSIAGADEKMVQQTHRLCVVIVHA